MPFLNWSYLWMNGWLVKFDHAVNTAIEFDQVTAMIFFHSFDLVKYDVDRL